MTCFIGASLEKPLGTKPTNAMRSTNANSDSRDSSSTSVRYRFDVISEHSMRPCTVCLPCFSSRSPNKLSVERSSMSRPSNTSSKKAWTEPITPSSVKCWLRPVSIKVLKSMGPTRSVSTVFSVNCRANKLGSPVVASKIRPSTARASWLLAVPGGPNSSTCSRDSKASAICVSTSSRSKNAARSSRKYSAKRCDARPRCPPNWATMARHSSLRPPASRGSVDADFPLLLVAVAASALLHRRARVGRALDDGHEFVALLVLQLVDALAEIDEQPSLVVAAVALPLHERHAVGGGLTGHVDDLLALHVGDAKEAGAVVVEAPRLVVGLGRRA